MDYITLSQVPELVEGPARDGNVSSVTGVSTSSTTLLDNAIVSFNEGSQLGKFYFGEQNANIYLPQGGEAYAIAYSDKQGEMPLNFKANENGTYTLTVNPKGVEVGYLHLIDNMTRADIDLLAGPSTGSGTFAFISNGNIIVNGTGTLQVVDMMGRVVRCADVARNVSTNEMMPGIYVLRLISGNDVKTQKIVIE